jgi:DnaJ-domain-containing protein 1
VLIVVPVLQKEIPLLQAQIPAFLAKANDLLAPLQELGVKVRLDSAGIKQLARQMATSGDAIWSTVLNSARVGGTAVLGWLATWC